MRKGFTLLEVLLSVAIFLLIAGGIYLAVSAATRASADIALARLDSERMDSFQRFLRTVFSNLPRDAKVELRVRSGPASAGVIELLLSPVPDLADFTRDAQETGGAAISAIPDGAGTYTISVANFDSEADPTKRDKQIENANWIPLLREIRDIRWRFLAANAQDFEEAWDAGKGRPVLADLAVTLPDGGISDFQFAIPGGAVPGSGSVTPQGRDQK